jgi:DNA polymerase-1
MIRKAVLRLLADVEARGIELQADGERLRFRPLEAMTPHLAERLKARKAEVLASLQPLTMPAVARSVVPSQTRCGPTPALGSYNLVKNRAGLRKVTAALDRAPSVGLDVETTGLNPRADRVRLLSLAPDIADAEPAAFLVDCHAVDPAPLWGDLAGKTLVLHNAAFDLAFLARLGFTATGKVHDTMLLAQLLTAGTFERNDLAACCERYLGRVLDKDPQKSDWSGKLTRAQLAYAATDAAVVVLLRRVLASEIKKAGLNEIAKIEQRCLSAVVWMAGQGVLLSSEAWEALALDAEKDARRLRRKLDKAASPGTWNWKSHIQVKQALAHAGCKVKDTKAATLAAVDHPLAQQLLRHREADKRATTYGSEWLKHVSDDGRVYPGWRQIGAASGRMSCRNPNMQQLPRRGGYRECVVAPPNRVLVIADYSQIELRIAANVSGDTALMEAYRDEKDLHIITAQTVLGIENVTPEHRQLAKALNFGLLYGMGAPCFRQYAKCQYGLDMTENEARRYRDAFFKSYPGLARWHRSIPRAAMDTRTLAGRRRRNVAKFTEKLNTPVQGTGADGLKLALALLWERRDQAPGAFPVLAVHDEIVVECDEAQAGAVSAWLEQAMRDGMEPLIDPVPVEVKVEKAQTWGG